MLPGAEQICVRFMWRRPRDWGPDVGQGQWVGEAGWRRLPNSVRALRGTLLRNPPRPGFRDERLMGLQGKLRP